MPWMECPTLLNIFLGQVKAAGAVIELPTNLDGLKQFMGSACRVKHLLFVFTMYKVGDCLTLLQSMRNLQKLSIIADETLHYSVPHRSAECALILQKTQNSGTSTAAVFLIVSD